MKTELQNFPALLWMRLYSSGNPLLLLLYDNYTEKMADDDLNGDSDEAQKTGSSQKKVAKHDSGAADLEKVTDYAEEKEISSSENISELTFIGDRRTKEAADKIARERELAKVSIKKEDVDIIVRELEISRSVAERSLREHQGNIVNALAALTQ